MSMQCNNLNELHDQFINAGFIDFSDKELMEINGGITAEQFALATTENAGQIQLGGYYMSTARNFAEWYGGFGLVFNAMTGN